MTQAFKATQSSRPIISLPSEVVQKIAAGEVVVRPLNAVKELIENSIDAGATEITVTCKNGGLDFIKVKDNGCGINLDDYERVCERFATSKLKTASDLQKVSTFGFRGEALASVSCMAKVQIISKTREADHAWTTHYKNCKPLLKPTPSPGLPGTQVIVEKLFYDYPQRRAVFNRPNEEAVGVGNVVIRYAINFPHIKFAFVREDGTNRSGSSFTSIGNGNQHATIRSLMPSNLTKDLFGFEVSSEKYKFSAKVCMAHPVSIHTSRAVKAKNDKQKVFQLFINNRLVTSTKLKQAVDSAFSTNDVYSPFTHISMQIEPSRIDVNVHPTKEVVCFLDETKIIDCIQAELFEIMYNFRQKGIIEVEEESNGRSSSTKSTPKQTPAQESTKDPVVLHQCPSTSVELSPIKGNNSSFNFVNKRRMNTTSDSVNSLLTSKPKKSKLLAGDKFKFESPASVVSIYSASPNATVRVDSTNRSMKEYMNPNSTSHNISYQSLHTGEASEVSILKEAVESPSPIRNNGSYQSLLAGEVSFYSEVNESKSSVRNNGSCQSLPAGEVSFYSEVNESISPMRNNGSYQSLPAGEMSFYSKVSDESTSALNTTLMPEDFLNQTVGELPNDPHKHIFEALAEVKEESSFYLTDVINKSVFMGYIDVTHAAIQSENALFTVEVLPLLEELFYQKCLRSVGKQSDQHLMISTEEAPGGIPLSSLVDAYLYLLPDVQLPNESKFASREEAFDALISKFSQPEITAKLWKLGVSIVPGHEFGPVISSVAKHVDGYNPLLSQQVAQFGFDLICIDWEKPENVEKQIARAIARLYTPRCIVQLSGIDS
ncbi:DNA-mis-repair domain-containing protein [Aphelenchoides bicaudatus]|nr:DNA-mis-repair domain-containing protein [Aphelenchoides bicaudatus]